LSIQSLIQDIVANFHKQDQLYLTIAELSGEQLALLSNDDWLDKPDKLNTLLEKRQTVIKEIDRLNSHNKIAQAEVKQQSGIADFVLSNLESQLDEEQYKSLSQVVIGLGDLLANITKMDEQSHLLIKSKAGISKTTLHTNSQQVKNAYQEAMQQAQKPSK